MSVGVACRERQHAQKWFDENVYEDWTWEGMLEKFIKTQILGEEA